MYYITLGSMQCLTVKVNIIYLNEDDYTVGTF